MRVVLDLRAHVHECMAGYVSLPDNTFAWVLYHAPAQADAHTETRMDRGLRFGRHKSSAVFRLNDPSGQG